MIDIENIFGFKTVDVVSGEKIVFYRLIGTNKTIIHNKTMETVEVMDDVVGNDEDYLTYNETEFFEEYGGYHLGTDDASIEDLVRFEYKFIIDCERSDSSASARDMEKLNVPVSFADIAYKNFN